VLTALQQKAVWEGRLSAEIRTCYFADLSHRHQRKERWIIWASLVFSSGAFATLVSDWLPPRLRWITPVAAFVTVALNVCSLTASNERNAIECSDLHFKWNRLAREYERLWDDMYNDSALGTLDSLQERSAEISRGSTRFPNNKKLMLKWANHVILQHGLHPVA
jgi:hypothetical protein